MSLHSFFITEYAKNGNINGNLGNVAQTLGLLLYIKSYDLLDVKHHVEHQSDIQNLPKI